MILHLIPDEKVTLSFIERMDSVFGLDNQFFWIYRVKPNAERKYYSYMKNSHVIISNIKDDNSEQFIRFACKHEKVIVHSLPDDINIVNCLLLIKQRNQEIILIWGIWGGDLYNVYDFAHSIKVIKRPDYIKLEYLRKKLISKIDFVMSGCDYEELKKRYKTNAKQLIGTYSHKCIEIEPRHEDEKRNVLVGHSATKTCRHIEMMKTLLKYKGSIRVFCPLSYPNNPKYIKKVIRVGMKLFGEDFVPTTDFIPFDEYVKYLNDIDIGVFNNSKQQGFGNIINLLGLGKKIYISKDNNLRFSFPKGEYYIFDYDELDSDFLKLLTHEEAASNVRKIHYRMSDDFFKERWRTIFNAVLEK